MTVDHTSLIERLKAATGADNALDIAIDVALFEPDRQHKSVRPNAAGTKLVYSRWDGGADTYWAQDHTLNQTRRALAIELLTAHQAGAASQHTEKQNVSS